MVELIKTFCEINAVSGNEDVLRRYIAENICADSVSIDTMGNITALKKGSSGSDKKIMIVSHIDECGMIVTDINDDGYIKFARVGDTELRSLISKRVVIGDGVKGVIGMKAVHLQKAEERESVKKADELFIDIGAKDKKQAQKSVQKGDYICFDTEFSQIGSRIKGKALDRVGAAVVFEMSKLTPLYDTYFVFTVQKEVGMRGASVCAAGINPDYVIVLDSVETADMFDVKEYEINAKLGKGAVAGYADKYSLSDRELTEKLLKHACDKGISVQKAAVQKSMSDAGAINVLRNGYKTVNIGIPVRYTHTPVQIADMADIEAAKNLVQLALTI